VPKRAFLGCSFPVVVGISVILFLLLIVGFIVGEIGKSIFGEIGLSNWFSVTRPHPELPAEEVFTMFGFSITNTIIAAWITVVVLVRLSFSVTRRMKLVPGRMQSAFEFLIGWLYDLCRSVAGERNGRRFFPIVATIFLFVSFNAWLGLLPGFGSITITTDMDPVHLFRPANTDINMPLALALVSFVFVEFFGLRTLGRRYVVKFINVGRFFKSIRQIARGKIGAGLNDMFVGVIEIFIGFLELLSEFIRIISLTFRLFGNMTAGEILILVTVFLVPWLFVIPFYGLELLIGFIQALIFGGLTLIFLTLAVTPHEVGEH
jgi:F-type H+-transporting ATPase subunit a